MQELDDYFPSTFYTGVQVKYCLLEVRTEPSIMEKNKLHDLLSINGQIEYLEKHPEEPDVYLLKYHRRKRPLDFDLYLKANYWIGMDCILIQIVPAKGHANTIFVCNLGNEDSNSILENFHTHGKITDFEIIEEPKKMIRIEYEEALQALKALYNEHYSRVLEGSKVPLKVFYMEDEDYNEPNVFIVNLPEKCTDMDVYKVCRQYGIIVNIVRRYDQAYITFSKKGNAWFVEEMLDDCKMEGKKLVIYTL